ncbi:hypothetical protein Ait01nite_071340 [Actinoplanes italicus]|uniref:Uncharacterized protein DUF4259 n=1 Tax=Actinoplanes italicus TaxID=113567 RepID=A0A2T0KBW1_9ACTN|nr:DUF4259 domain-containing protein [Actinoplanes italicus]PRX20379.1 uncharacterized protein DUF4259 [Actinoplanes italicus]GIE34089.1 hypothetical protein Ait01nite_071340 [Actinoplanes italicus]
MATWNVGPFDNDDAVEWCDRLSAADPALRVELIERTLSHAVTHLADLNPASASEVFAAAAIVFQTATGKPATTTPYATVILADTEGVEPTPQLIGLACEALEVLMAGDSAFRRKWAGDVEEDLALEGAERVYDGLKGQLT